MFFVGVISMTKLIIHIGLPKTATTTVQNHLFKLLPNDKYNYIHEAKKSLILNETIFKTLYLDSSINGVSEVDYKSLLLKDKINIISDEVLTLPIQFKKNRHHKMIQNSKLLKKYFGEQIDYRILIVIRNQQEWLYSLFVQLYGVNLHVSKKPSSKFFEKGQLKEKLIKETDYSKLINAYTKTFGKNSIKILLFEDFKNDMETYVKGLSDVLDFDIDSIMQNLEGKHSNSKAKTNKGYVTDNFQTRKYILTLIKLRAKFALLDKLIKKIITKYSNI